MRLLEVVQNLSALSDDQTIYAAEPWTEHSEALLLREPEHGGLPEEARVNSLVYFLEVFVARGVLEDLRDEGGLEATQLQKCARLIQYAKNDA